MLIHSQTFPTVTSLGHQVLHVNVPVCMYLLTTGQKEIDINVAQSVQKFPLNRKGGHNIELPALWEFPY